MKAFRFLLGYFLLSLFIPKASFSCDPPEIISLACTGPTVIIEFQVSIDTTLLGFYFYRDDEFIEFMPQTGDTTYCHFLANQPPGDHVYCISAACVSLSLKSTADTVESETTCEETGCFYGFDLPFIENWSWESFEMNDWQISSDAWVISHDEGNDPPSAIFEPTESLLDYHETLESYYLNAYGMTEGHLYLTYDFQLSALNSDGTEHLLVQTRDPETGGSSTLRDYTNQEGSFGWISDTIDIRPYCMGKIFRLRFVAQGENSTNIFSWGIDNISVYRECNQVEYQLGSYLVNDTCIVLETIDPSARDLVDVLIYVYRDDVLIDIYSTNYPMPNPYCVSASGEYCFWMVCVWESESDQCDSWSNSTCEQVVISSSLDVNSKILLPCIIRNKILFIETYDIIDYIEIIDISGKILFSSYPDVSRYNCELYNLKSGLYIIRYTSARKIFSQKFVIP